MGFRLRDYDFSLSDDNNHMAVLPIKTAVQIYHRYPEDIQRNMPIGIALTAALEALNFVSAVELFSDTLSEYIKTHALDQMDTIHSVITNPMNFDPEPYHNLVEELYHELIKILNPADLLPLLGTHRFIIYDILPGDVAAIKVERE